MKLDRNQTAMGTGKYALILCRELTKPRADAKEIRDALKLLESKGVLDWGTGPGTPRDFFVMRLKDRHCAPALYAYAESCAKHDDREFADEVLELARASSEMMTDLPS